MRLFETFMTASHSQLKPSPPPVWLPDDALLAWRPYDPASPEGFGQMAWRDGSTFVAEHSQDVGDFFTRHPYFVRAEAVRLTPHRSGTRVWLTGYEPPQDASIPELPRQLNRPHDLLFHGWLDAGYDNFAVHPDVVALDYVFSDGDGPFLDSWQAKVWLKPR